MHRIQLHHPLHRHLRIRCCKSVDLSRRIPRFSSPLSQSLQALTICSNLIL